jgi:hypothetical protein
MVPALALLALAAAAQDPPPPAAFDGYALGMTIAEAEAVAPGRHSFACAKLMTSRCIVYDRRLGALSAKVTVQFALDDRRINQIQILPTESGEHGGTSCERAWSGLVSALAATYGEPQAREGNTARWRTASMALTATVLQEEDEFCDVSASLTRAATP